MFLGPHSSSHANLAAVSKGAKPRLASLDRALPVKAACQACRSRKQKCDGVTPSCARCVREGRSCLYVQSRRGRSFAHLHQQARTCPREAPRPAEAPGNMPGGLFATLELATTSSSANPSDSLSSISFGQPDAPDASEAVHPAEVSDYESGNRLFISYFYSFFWPSHPFILPPEACQQLFTAKADNLLRWVTYIGSLFAAAKLKNVQPLPLPALLDALPTSVESVQTLILHAIIIHMFNQPDQAHSCLNQAIIMALELGLDRREFTQTQGQSSFTFEESWRRTWWELFVLDTLFAALHNTGRPQISHLWLGVLLPTEDNVYRGKEPHSSLFSLEDFDDRVFAEYSPAFSSFAYRVAATRVLGQVLQASIDQDSTNGAKTREAELALDNLRLHLPEDKKNYARLNGAADEVLFQAHMIMNAAAIYLHRPQSDLAPIDNQQAILCVKSIQVANTGSVQHHTKMCLDASDKICLLTSSFDDITCHTPFFTCALATQAVVGLCAYWQPDLSQQQPVLHQQVQLAIGALKQLEGLWPMATIVLRQIKDIARTVLDRQKPCDRIARPEVVQAIQEDISKATSTPAFEAFLQDSDCWLTQFLD